MSISSLLRDAIKDGVLVEVRPLIPGTPETRAFYATREIHSFVTSNDERWLLVRTDLERFIAGEIISLATRPRETKGADIARLDPGTDEVWEFRHVKPKPPIRIFGRFFSKDYFIALDWDNKPTANYRRANRRVRAAWNRIFLTHLPVNGEFDDYVSNYLRLP